MQAKGSNDGPERLPIWRDSQRLLREMENTVRGFPRYQKYTVGAGFRRETLKPLQCKRD